MYARKLHCLTSETIQIVRGSIPALLTLLLTGLACQTREAVAETRTCTIPESGPIVEIVRKGPFQGIEGDAYAEANYDDLIGTISNSNFRRFWDGTCGSYKVPVRIVAPKGAACNVGRLAHVGLIEFLHPNVIGSADFPPGSFSGVIHGWNDPVYDPLLDHGSEEAWLNLRAPFLFGHPSHGGSGVVYMGFQAENYFGSLDYINALPENSGIGLHLPRPQDYAILYRDVSKWLRQAKTPQNFVNAGRSNLCSVSDVIGFGYSATSELLKAVISNPHRLNSTWGRSDRVFPRGRVMDGTLLAGQFGESPFAFGCPDVTASEDSQISCVGPHKVSEGPMVIVQSETEIQFLGGLTLRHGTKGHPKELDYYKVHEINSASHIEVPYLPAGPILEYFGVDPSLTRQNPLDRSPVLRADFINLLKKIRTNTPLPDSTYMAAHDSNTWQGIGIVALEQRTGNGFGGITLPQAAAPLGLYRGIDCHAIDPFFDISDAYHYALPPVGSGDLRTGRANFVLERIQGSPERVCESGVSIEGIFTPYKVVDDALGTSFCGALYPTRQAYLHKVTVAADRLIMKRFLLPEDRDDIIAAAKAEADKYPECVPSH